MPKIALELESSLGDHTPIRVFACGETEKEILDDAHWYYDVPNPSRHYALGDLPSPTMERLEQRLCEEFREKIGGGLD